MKGMRAALGFRAHSGWAALVAVAGTRGQVVVVDRRRIELGDPSAPGPKQPYHEAEGKPLAQAKRIVDRFADDAGRRALEALRCVLVDLRARGHEVVGCGLLTASNKPLPQLGSILASHALIHTADGELFRDALAGAAKKCRVPLARVRERELAQSAANALRASGETLQRRVGELGRGLGPPWTQDQKLAALAAWMCLG